MTPTKVLSDQKKVKEVILRGVNAVYDPVKLTLGPSGRSFLAYGTFGREPRIFDDGHMGAQVIEPRDEYENLVAKTFKESTAKTNQLAGDGTCSTTVLGAVLINTIFRKAQETSGSFYPQEQFDVRKICNELLELSNKVSEEVANRAIKIDKLEDLKKIAVISVGNADLGKIIASIVWETGVDGYVDVVEGFKGEIETEVMHGARFPAKPAAKAFINNGKKFEMVAEDAKVILTNYKLDNVKQIQEFLSSILPNNKKLVILAPDFSEKILTGFFQTVFQPLPAEQGGGFARTGIDIYPVKVPSLRTEQFEDLSVYFGAKFINKETGKKLENITEEDLGFVGKLVVKDTESRDDAVAIGGKGMKEDNMRVGDKDYEVSSPVKERIAMLKGQLEETKEPQFKKVIERRIGSLASAVGVIRVGATSRAELMPKKMKIEDAVYASKSALQEGYVKGGGLCLKEIAEELPASILTVALKAPYEQIQVNAGGKLEIADYVIDPAKVVRLSVENAVSVAANLITVGVLVAEEREKNPTEGYEAIADAINMFNRLWNKKEAIWKDNEMEMKLDEMARHESIMQNDNG